MLPQYYVLMSCAVAWFIAQTAKIVYNKLKFDVAGVFAAGQMPSSHSAFTVGFTSALFLADGLTLLSAACLVFTTIVLRDALFRHKPWEIAAGTAIGIVTSVALKFAITALGA